MAHLFPPDAYMDRSIKYNDINPHIKCTICNGYLIDATTVIECIHTFCKSCLVKHLQTEKTCPNPDCGILIHQSHPLNYISYDRTMADIVNKLAPHLVPSETERENEFYQKRGLPCPRLSNVNRNGDIHATLEGKDVCHNTVSSNSNSSRSSFNGKSYSSVTSNGLSNQSTNENCKKKLEQLYRPPADELIPLEIQPHSSLSPSAIVKKFLLCSAHTTVTQLLKFIAKRLFNDHEKFSQIEILCDGHLLGKEHSLKYIFVTHWRFKGSHLNLVYRTKLTV